MKLAKSKRLVRDQEGAAMRRKRIKEADIFVLLGALIITGCAAQYTPSKAKMIPLSSPASFVSSGKTLKLGEIQAGEVKTDPFVLVSKIEAKDFAEALRDALENSGIFSQIVTQQQADYELNSEIISQEVKVGFPTNAILLVHYHLDLIRK